MKNLMNLNDVNTKIIVIRNQNVILDSDVAALYGVQTKEVNQAVKNNPGKFPDGYVLPLQSIERQQLVKNFDRFLALNKTDNQEPVTTCDRFKNLKHASSVKAFTEKGLYMLATILKSPQAVQTTIAIVEAFAKLREVANNLAMLNSIENVENLETIEPEVITRTGNLLTDLFFSGIPTAAETSFEVNLGLAKMKRSVKSENPAFHDEIAEMKQMIMRLEDKLNALTS